MQDHGYVLYFILLHVDIQYSSIICWRCCLPSGAYLWDLYLKSEGFNDVHWYIALLFHSITVRVCFCVCITLFLLLQFYTQVEIQSCSPSFAVLSAWDCVDYLESLWLYMNSRILISTSVRNAMESLIGIELNLQITFGRMFIFIILILPSLEHPSIFKCLSQSLSSEIFIYLFSVQECSVYVY